MHIRASKVALVIKNPPANAGGIRDVGSTPGWGRSPGATHSSIQAWKILCTEEPGRFTVLVGNESEATEHTHKT